MSSMISHRADEHDYNERIAYNRQLEAEDKKKRSKSRQKRGFWQRAWKGGLGAVNPKVFHRMMKITVVTNLLLLKQQLKEIRRKLEYLGITTDQFNVKSLRSLLKKLSQIINNVEFIKTQISNKSVVKLGVGCKKKLSQPLVLTSGFFKGKASYQSYPKIIKLFHLGKKVKNNHIAAQENPYYNCESFDEAPKVTVKQTELISIPKATITDFFVKKPPLIAAYHRYIDARGTDRQRTYTNFETLLRNCKDNINDRDSDGKTLLHYAAANNDLTTAIELTKCSSIDLNIQDNNGDTARDVAVQRGFDSIANLFSEKISMDYVSNQRLSDSDTVEYKNQGIKVGKLTNIVNAANFLPKIDSISSDVNFRSHSIINMGEFIC